MMFRDALKNKRAFSLIEAAIVLGIIGLVIGGIWVAASAVAKKQKINDALSFLARVTDVASKNAKVWDAIGGSHNINDLVMMQSLPGGYGGPVSNYIGTPGVYFSLEYAGSFGLYIPIKFSGGPADAAPYPANSALCVALSNFFLSHTFSPGGDLHWGLEDNSGYVSGSGWTAGDPKPSGTSLLSWCAATGSILVQGMQP